MRFPAFLIAAVAVAAAPLLAACTAQNAADAPAPAVVAAGPATPVTPEQGRRKLLDACVIEVSARPEFSGLREKSVSLCQCAASKAQTQLDPAVVAGLSYGTLPTGDVRQAIYAGISDCN